MSNILDLITTDNKALDLLNNPFKKECVEKITIEIYSEPSSFRKSVECQIRFINGSTSGYHKIGADNLESALYQIKTLIDSLENDTKPAGA